MAAMAQVELLHQALVLQGRLEALEQQVRWAQLELQEAQVRLGELVLLAQQEPLETPGPPVP